MTEIKQYNFHTQEALNYYKWISTLWDKVEPYMTIKHNLQIPEPLLAMNQDELMGGLSFTVHKDPTEDIYTLWVNTIFIEDSHRRRGLATKLLKEAMALLRYLGYDRLYAYTDYPELYTKSGWYEVENTKSVVGVRINLESRSS